MRLQQFIAIAWIFIALAGSGTLIAFSIESIAQSQEIARAIFMAGRRTARTWPLCVQTWKPIYNKEKIDTSKYII